LLALSLHLGGVVLYLLDFILFLLVCITFADRATTSWYDGVVVRVVVLFS